MFEIAPSTSLGIHYLTLLFGLTLPWCRLCGVPCWDFPQMFKPGWWDWSTDQELGSQAYFFPTEKLSDLGLVSESLLSPSLCMWRKLHILPRIFARIQWDDYWNLCTVLGTEWILSNLYTKCGVWTHNPEIESHMLHLVSQPGAPDGTCN